ncbi:MAG: SDR family oxidoreductase [Candidatus Sericytochromatia bacterium]|nr:SDR family oxidoreductase [Candidatus Sericytochromatia bacterium]
MRLVLTGATGFLGAAAARAFGAAGHEVVPFARSLGHDLGTGQAVPAIVAAAPDAIVHLAGRTFVPESWREPALFVRDNVMATQEVLDACRLTGASLLHVSAYVYGQPCYLPIDERHPVAPGTPYAHSKWLAEELCRFQAGAFGVPLTVLRPFNIYGPGQRPPMLVADLASQLLRDGRMKVLDLEPRRDFLHVDDFSAALVRILDAGAWGHTFNVGSGRSHSVREVVEILAAAWPGGADWACSEQVRPAEVPDVVADCGALRDVVGWAPSVTFEKGLQAMIREMQVPA